MSERRANTSRSKRAAENVAPDSLMTDFQGRPFVAIVAVTLIVHALLISVTSYSYVKNQIFGEDTSSLSEEERMTAAVKEATISLRKIAERHGLRPQDLSERFASGGSAPVRPASATDESDEPANPAEGDEPPSDDPQSAIERDLQEKEDGPELPALPSIDDEEDLF